MKFLLEQKIYFTVRVQVNVEGESMYGSQQVLYKFICGRESCAASNNNT
uniref:Uncharacterized protein n=1 Tax=Triticum urartu TaxID=4572 RepID=A0A8R7QSU3_TRIUA